MLFALEVIIIITAVTRDRDHASDDRAPKERFDGIDRGKVDENRPAR
jgi:hypothetical protein